jgi:hypothetical protein
MNVKYEYTYLFAGQREIGYLALIRYRQQASVTPRGKGESDFAYRCRVIGQYVGREVVDWEIVDA